MSPNRVSVERSNSGVENSGEAVKVSDSVPFESNCARDPAFGDLRNGGIATVPANGLRVLVACEFSGVVRDAFARLGCDAWSCDLLPSLAPGQHIQGDVMAVLDGGWDIMVAHPPCTHLAVSGARHFPAKIADGRQASALAMVQGLLSASVQFIALENPVSIISTRIRRPDQTFQPWQHGHGEVKRTCLWLKNLPHLRPSCIVEGRAARVHLMPPGPDRWKLRSVTLPGVARAMAEQWVDYALSNAVQRPPAVYAGGL